MISRSEVYIVSIVTCDLMGEKEFFFTEHEAMEYAKRCVLEYGVDNIMDVDIFMSGDYLTGIDDILSYDESTG